MPRLWEPLAEKHRPSTASSATFSAPYGIALGLVKGAAGLAEFTSETIADKALLNLVAKVRYRIDTCDPFPDDNVGDFQVKRASGETVTARQPHLRGGRLEPLSNGEVMARFRANAAFGGWSDALTDACEQFCGDLFTLDTVASLQQFRH